MPSKMEIALDDIIDIYHDYASRNPSDDYLHEEEFKLLLEENAEDFLDRTQPVDMTREEYLRQLFQEADKNNSEYLQFEEFVTTLGRLAINAHNKSHEPGSTGHGNRGHEHRQHH